MSNDQTSLMSRIRSILHLRKRERVQQTMTLYVSEILLIFLTLGTGVLNSRWLGATEYGVYTFVVTVVDVLMIFSGFGYPQSGARVVALVKDQVRQRSVLGSLVWIGLIMGGAMSLALLVLTPVIEMLFKTGRQESLILSALLSFTTPMQLILLQACRGANKVGAMALLKVLPKGLYLVGGLLMVNVASMNARVALALYFVGALISCVVAVVQLRVVLKGARAHIPEVTAEVKRYGFYSFLGGIADNSTFKLNNLLIAGHVSTTWLGFYSIASTMVSPMVAFSSSLSNSLYRSLTDKHRLSPKVFLVNGGFLVLAGTGIALCARFVIEHVLTAQFLPATELVYILVFTAFFQGMYQPINAFLGAHGRGKESRNISLVVCCVNLGVAFLLIPRYGAFGAATGSAVAKFTEMMGNIYYYRKISRELSSRNAQMQAAPAGATQSVPSAAS